MAEPGVDVAERRQPVLGEAVDELRPVRPVLGDDDVRVAVPRHAAAGPVGLDQVGHRGAATHEPLGHAGHQRGTGRVDEDLLVARRQRVAASLGVGGRVVDVDERGDGLLLEPLARVARGDAGRGGELGGGQRTALGQRPVEAELGAEVDRQQVERAERGLEQASDEGVAALGRVLGCGHRHGVSPGRSASCPLAPA